jgi:ABC-type enterochelin transport system substrate-binding protein
MRSILIVLGVAFAGFILLFVVAAVSPTDADHHPVLSEQQEAAAQELAQTTRVKHNDGSIGSLDINDARVMVEDCSALQKTKYSDMTPLMLSVWGTCRSHGIDR